MTAVSELQTYRDEIAALLGVSAPVGRPNEADQQLRQLLKATVQIGEVAIEALSGDEEEEL